MRGGVFKGMSCERTQTQFVLEPMTPSHGDAVVEIFNYYITNSFAAYREQPVPRPFFERLLQATEGYPAYVAVDEAKRVVGFAFLRPFRQADSLRRTAEITYFLAPEATRRGLGTALLNRLIEQAKLNGIDTLLADISSRNPASIAFHRKHGFHECGRFERVGRKHGQDFDIVWMQKHL